MAASPQSPARAGCTVQQVVAALTATLDRDNARRKAAEEALTRMESAPGFLPHLLAVICGPSTPQPCRHSAVLFLKNGITRRWNSGSPGDVDPDVVFNEPDKAHVRDRLLTTIGQAGSHYRIAQQLAVAFATIAKHDYPDRMADLPQRLKAMIETRSPGNIMGALLVLRYASRRWSSARVDAMRPLSMLWTPLLATVEQVAVACGKSPAPEAAQSLRVLLKAYYAATKVSLVPPFTDTEQLKRWHGILHGIMQRPAPGSVRPAPGTAGTGPYALDDADLMDSPEWRLKKWTARIIEKFAYRHANPEFAKDHSRAAVTYYNQVIAPGHLPGLINALAAKAAGAQLPRVVHYSALNAITQCVSLSSCWKVLRGRWAALFEHSVMPILCFTREDKDLWDEDKVEYVFSRISTVPTNFDMRLSAIDFIKESASSRAKLVLAQTAIPWLGRVMAEYKAAGQRGNSSLKYGAMMLLGVLVDHILERPKFGRRIEPLMLEHVLPEMDSPHAHLRYRAVWTFAQYATLPWDTKSRSFERGMDRVIRALADPEEVVQFTAATSMHLLMENPACEPLIDRHLQPIVQQFIKIFARHPFDEVVSGLSALLHRFGHKMGAMAPKIIDTLLASFQHFVRMDQASDNAPGAALLGDSAGQDAAEMTAANCLDAAGSLIEAVSDTQLKPDEMQALVAANGGQQPSVQQLTGIMQQRAQHASAVLEHTDRVVVPVVIRCLTDGELIEYFDVAMNVVNSITKQPRRYSPATYAMLASLIDGHIRFSPDYVGVSAPTIGRVIAADFEGLLRPLPAGSPFPNLLEGIQGLWIKLDRDMPEEELREGLPIITNIIANGKRRIDAFVAKAVVKACQSLAIVKQARTKTCLCSIVAAALLYDTPTVLQGMQSQGVLNTWLRMVSETLEPAAFRSPLDRKLTTLALTKLFSLPLASVPSPPNLMAVLLHFLNAEFEDEDDEEEEDEEDEEEEHTKARARGGGGTEDDEDNDEHDVVDAEDMEYAEMLKELQAQRDAAQASNGGKVVYIGGLMSGPGPEADEDADEIVQGHPLAHIQQINRLVFFFDTMGAIAGSQAAQWQQLMSALPEAARTDLNEYIRLGREEKGAAAASPATGAAGGPASPFASP